MHEQQQFGLPDGYAERTERSLNIMLGHGDREAARVLIEKRRAEYPAYGDYLAAKYSREPGR